MRRRLGLALALMVMAVGGTALADSAFGGGTVGGGVVSAYCPLTGCTMTGQTVYNDGLGGPAVSISTGTNVPFVVAPAGYATGATWSDFKGAVICEPGANDYGLVVAPEANGRAIKLSADSTNRITDPSTGPTMTLLVKKGTQTDNEIGSWATSVGNVTGAPLLVRDSKTQFVSVDGGVIDTIDIANQNQVLNGYLVVNQTSGTAIQGATIESDPNGRGMRIVAPTNYNTSTFVSTGYGVSIHVKEGATTNNIMASYSNSNVGTVSDIWHQAANTIWSNTQTTQQAKLVNSTGELDLGPTTQQLVFVPSTGTISTATNGNLTLSPGQHSASGNSTIINGLLRSIADNGNTGFVQVSDNLGRGIEICGQSGWTGTGGGTCAAAGIQFNVVQSGGTTTNTIVSYSNHSTATKSGLLISTSALTLDAFGTGLLHSSSAGVLTSAAVTLSGADVTGTLAVTNGGSGVTTSTGTTNLVLSNSPTLVTPVLGAASATSIKYAITTSALATCDSTLEGTSTYRYKSGTGSGICVCGRDNAGTYTYAVGAATGNFDATHCNS